MPRSVHQGAGEVRGAENGTHAKVFEVNGTLIECSTLITDVGFDFDARVQSMEAFQ